MKLVVAPWLLVLALLVSAPISARAEQVQIETTAYSSDGESNGYTRGSWMFLKLDVWNRYINYGRHKGTKYTGKTASGKRLVSQKPGLLSGDTFRRPYMIPVRILPWNLMSRPGTIAADTNYYPFGTRMYVPGYGWGIVEDRGGAIKGPNRIDLFFPTKRAMNRWGRKTLTVTVVRP